MQHHEGRETHSLTNNPFADFRPPTWLRTLSLSLILIPLTTLRVSCSSSQDEGTGGSDWGVLSESVPPCPDIQDTFSCNGDLEHIRTCLYLSSRSS